MPFLVVKSTTELLVRARMKLGHTQQEMADAVGSSLRTVSRWEGKQAHPSAAQLHTIAALLHPLDANLAHDAAVAAGTTLEALGIVKPPPPPAPPPPPPQAPPPPPLPLARLVDAVVCAVATALEGTDGAPVSMASARAAAAAALRSARELRLDLDEASRVLAPESAEAKARPRRGSEPQA